MSPDPVFSAQALRDARLRAGLTQGELARRIGVAGGERVSEWERGQARVRSATRLHALAAALGVNPVDLLQAPSGRRGLRWYRMLAGLTPAELARAASVSVPTVKRWEAHGTARGLPVATLTGLAAALGVTPDAVAEALRR